MRYLLMTDNHLLAHHFAVVCADRGSVSETPCGPEAARDVSPFWLQERRTDALLLDLPERLTLRAPALIAAWRARCPGVPVMVVMPGATPYTVRAVLGAGADGCHDDICDVRVLAARVEALVRRRLGWYRTEVLDCPPLRLETGERRLRQRLAGFPQVRGRLSTCRGRGYMLDIRDARTPPVRCTG